MKSLASQDDLVDKDDWLTSRFLEPLVSYNLEHIHELQSVETCLVFVVVVFCKHVPSDK